MFLFFAEVQLEQVNCQSAIGGSSPAAAPASSDGGALQADDDCQMDECMDMRDLQHQQQYYGTNVTSL